MDDTISRQAAIYICQHRLYESALNNIGYECKADEVFSDIAQNRIQTWLEEVPSAQRKGKWIEKKVIPVYENGFPLQSCKCSECDRYDTRPYMYYFSEPNFCSYCGAKMVKGEEDENNNQV